MKKNAKMFVYMDYITLLCKKFRESTLYLLFTYLLNIVLWITFVFLNDCFFICWAFVDEFNKMSYRGRHTPENFRCVVALLNELDNLSLVSSLDVSKKFRIDNF